MTERIDAWRDKSGKNITIGICGPGNAGKDLFASFLVDEGGPRYSNPTSCCSWHILPFIKERVREIWGKNSLSSEYKVLEMQNEELYGNRRKHRGIWRECGDIARQADPLFLVKEALKYGDIVTGLRSKAELNHALFNVIIWIDRPGLYDPTLEIGPSDCDITIANHGDVGSLHLKAHRLVGLLETYSEISQSGVVIY